MDGVSVLVVDGAFVLVAPGVVVALAVLALVVTSLEVLAPVVLALVVLALVVFVLVVFALVVPTLVVEIVVDVVDGPVYGVVVVKKCLSCNLQVVLEHHALESPSPISPKCSCNAKFDESRMVNQKT